MYRITVSKLEPCKKENSYSRYDAETIFEQVLDRINLWGVITAVNSLAPITYYYDNSDSPYGFGFTASRTETRSVACTTFFHSNI